MTAIQELNKWATEKSYTVDSRKGTIHFVVDFYELATKMNELLQGEKQQIIDAFNQGYRDGEHYSFDGNKKDIAEYSDAEYYYNELAEKK